MDEKLFIAVGYDGSPASDAALLWAAKMAALRHEDVVATLVIDPLEHRGGMSWPDPWVDQIQDSARAVLEKVPDVDLEVTYRVGPKVATLSESGRGASMLVVGSQGHSLVGEAFLGSVSQGLARHASPPVVVVRRSQTPDAGQIVVGYDTGPTSRRALEFACATAELTGDKVIILHAWQPGPTAERHGYLAPAASDSTQQVQTELQSAVDDMRLAHPAVAIQGELVATAPEQALVSASSSASLVVVGTQPHGAVAEVVLGSISHDVLRRAVCPVAVVK